MDSYKMEHPIYEFLFEKKTNYKTRFSPYTHGMIDKRELRLHANLNCIQSQFFIKWSL
jgi:hypothetical protein